MKFDVFCIGMSCVDLNFLVEHHPSENEKVRATRFSVAGGGPAANAAVCVARLGGRSGLAASLGTDPLGENEVNSLRAEGVDTTFVDRSLETTALAAVIAKEDGKRSVVSHANRCLQGLKQPVEQLTTKVILADGHQPIIAQQAIDRFADSATKVVLDAGSAHEGTRMLAGKVDYLVASENFATSVSGSNDRTDQLNKLSELCGHVVITYGEGGLVWHRPDGRGQLNAFEVESVDETGAGDAFHAGFAFSLARGDAWRDIIAFASACGALACTQFGARTSMPTLDQVEELLRSQA